MRIVVAIPAVGLLAGAALGLLVPEFPPIVGCALLLAAGAAAVWAWRGSRTRLLAVSVALAFLAGGSLLAARAWHEAWRPSLRLAFEELASMEREDAAATGRILPEDAGAFVVLTGVLRADASPRDNTVSLSVDVLSLDTQNPVNRAGDTARGLTRDTPGFIGPLPRASEFDALPTSCSRPVRGGVLLTVVGEVAKSRVGDWRAGRIVRAPAQLHRPSRYLDPGVPDEERALARRGTSLVGTIKSGALVEVVARGSALAEGAAEVRAFVRRAVASAVGRWSPRAAAIVTAIVIGDRAGLEDDVQRRLQEAGTYHVIAISGGNIAILAGLTLAAFRIAGLLGRAAMLSAIAGLVAYGYLVGGGASVDRATLMAVVYFAARAIDLRGPPFNALALVAGILVATQPLAIADPAFLLTFGATAAILSPVTSGFSRTISSLVGRDASRSFVDAGLNSSRVGSNIRRTFRWPSISRFFVGSGLRRTVQWLLPPIATMLAASAAAEAALFPVSAMIFSRVTFAGLVLNFAAIPLMAVAQIAGMLLVPVSMVSSAAASAIGWIAFVGAEGLVRSADLVQFAPFVTWRVAPPHWFAVALYYAGLVVLWLLWTSRSSQDSPVVSGFSRTVSRIINRPIGVAMRPARLALRASVLVSVGAAIWILAEPWASFRSRGDGRLHVTFIDVGQGDAALVQFPRGATLVVDAGGLSGSSGFDVGDRVVAPVLRRAGVRWLETVALTHGDADHIGGARSLLDEFHPGDVWEGIPVPPFEPLQVLRATARKIGARWTNVQRADLVTIDDVEIFVRHPALADWERQDVRNDDSIVLELQWGEVSVVLTGDIGREVEQAIAPLFPPSPLRVVKVPHHGSLTSSSSDFVRALAPRIAVVSVGRSNSFGHPAPAVLGRYRDAGAEIFRTDRDGAVMLDTDGHGINLKTFTGRTLSLH